MFRGRYVVLAIFSAWVFGESLCAQVPATIDFGRDVLPIFRQNCIGCHGPTQQINGLRLDRKSSVMKSGASCQAAAITAFFITGWPEPRLDRRCRRRARSVPSKSV